MRKEWIKDIWNSDFDDWVDNAATQRKKEIIQGRVRHVYETLRWPRIHLYKIRAGKVDLGV